MTAGIREITLNDLMSPSGGFWGALQLEEPPVNKGSLSCPVNDVAVFRPRVIAPRGAIVREILELVVKTPTWAEGASDSHPCCQPGWAGLHSLTGPRGMTFVFGGRRTGRNPSGFLYHKKFQPKPHKESWQHFILNSQDFCEKFQFQLVCFPNHPHPRVLNSLWSESVLQHCFVTTPN